MRGRVWTRHVRAAGLALECATALVVASVRVALTPRDRLVAGFGPARPGTPRPRGTPPLPIVDPVALDQFRVGRRVGHMVERVARLLPWRPTCLRQAIATRRLLRRRGVPNVMHLGVASAREMDAHAWVTVHQWSVVGQRLGAFTPVASFDG